MKHDISVGTVLVGWVENAVFQNENQSMKHPKLENQAPQTENNLFRHASAFSRQSRRYRKVAKVTTLVTCIGNTMVSRGIWDKYLE